MQSVTLDVDFFGHLWHNEPMLRTLKQTAELVELFRAQGVKQSFRKGDFVIRPGDPPHGVFYIYNGLVKAYDITKYNEENLLIIRKEVLRCFEVIFTGSNN